MTTIILGDTMLQYSTLSHETFKSPLSLDALAYIVNTSDQARVILFMRHGSEMPSNIIGVYRCGIS